MRMFSGRDLLRIGKRLDRVAQERAEDEAAPTVEKRADAVESEGRRLRGLLRGKDR